MDGRRLCYSGPLRSSRAQALACHAGGGSSFIAHTERQIPPIPEMPRNEFKITEVAVSYLQHQPNIYSTKKIELHIFRSHSRSFPLKDLRNAPERHVLLAQWFVLVRHGTIIASRLSRCATDTSGSICFGCVFLSFASHFLFSRTTSTHSNTITDLPGRKLRRTPVITPHGYCFTRKGRRRALGARLTIFIINVLSIYIYH